MERGDLNIRQILILDFQLQVSMIPFAGMLMSGFSTGTTPQAAFEHL